jgi:hypothetical protein
MRIKPSANSLPFLIGALCFTTSAFATDLMQVYREALSNDQQYAAARATAEAGREKGPQGLSGLLPTIGTDRTISHRCQIAIGQMLIT